MSKLKISSIPDDKPVRFKIDLPAAVHRDLMAYAEILSRENGYSVEPGETDRPDTCAVHGFGPGFLASAPSKPGAS